MTTTHDDKQTWKNRPRQDARLELRVPADLLAALRSVAAALWPGYEESWYIDEPFWDGAETLRCPQCDDDRTAYSGWHFVTTTRKFKPREEWVETTVSEMFGDGRFFAKLPPGFGRACHLLGLKPEHRLVLVAPWPYQARGGTCRPKVESTIMDETGLTKRMVLRAIKELEGRDLLRVTRGRAGQRSAPNEYDLTPFWVKAADVLRVRKSTSETSASEVQICASEISRTRTSCSPDEKCRLLPTSGCRNRTSQTCSQRCRSAFLRGADLHLEVEGLKERTATPERGLQARSRRRATSRATHLLMTLAPRRTAEHRFCERHEREPSGA